jgi:formylglycine-generating enzyme required for sulfatase activity
MKRFALTTVAFSILLAACGSVATPVLVPTQPPTALPPTETATLAPTPVPTATATPMPGIGSRWTRPADGMVMVYVPAGEFQMGNDSGLAEVKPAHTVTLDAFWIDQTEVTNGMYDLCVQAGKCEPPSQNGTHAIAASSQYGDAQYKDYPVIYVNWDRANAYCAWAGATSGMTVRLPTEAEWEKAARGENGGAYPWGNDLPNCSRANFTKYSVYIDNSVMGINALACKDNTIPVGGLPEGASPYGALDMAGNVWEWVADWYAPYSSDAVSNPTGPATGSYKIVRGGGWNMDINYLYTYTRTAYYPSYTEGNIGFRCVWPQP